MASERPLYFFFQAEDGIRCWSVTGVQTCALPISHVRGQLREQRAVILFGVFLPLGTLFAELATHMCAGTFFDPIPTWWHVALVALVPVANLARSEERRVGKECRFRRSATPRSKKSFPLPISLDGRRAGERDRLAIAVRSTVAAMT